jgi:delta-aminolevulinic acid dehydratase/porphobilinogen synthase
MRETRLDLDDFVMPLFVGPLTEPNEALPAMGRWSADGVGEDLEDLHQLPVPGCATSGSVSPR